MIRFSDFRCNDGKPPISMEEAVHRLLAYASNHALVTDSKVYDDFSGTLADWEVESGDWSIASGVLVGSGTVDDEWHTILHSTEVKVGFIATFLKLSDSGGFLFCSDGSRGYLCWWTPASVGFSSIDNGVETILCALPVSEPGDGRATVAVWPVCRSAVDTADELLMGLWLDGKQLVVHSERYDDSFGSRIGFAVRGLGVAMFDELRVPQFHRLVEWTSVDPGESVSAGLSRVLGVENARLLARYDGTVRLWRNESSAPVWSVEESRISAAELAARTYWPSHLRLVGAVHEADSLRNGQQGHIFALASDPNALTDTETQERARFKHSRAEGAARTLTLYMPPNPLVEPEDTLTVFGGQWRVSSIDYSAMWQGNPSEGGPVLQSVLKLRGEADDDMD